MTAIVAFDLDFHLQQARTFARREAASGHSADPVHALEAAQRNGTLQGACLMLAAGARELGMTTRSTGFSAGSSLRSDFLCNLGHADHADLLPRQPRLGFDEICAWA